MNLKSLLLILLIQAVLPATAGIPSSRKIYVILPFDGMTDFYKISHELKSSIT